MKKTDSVAIVSGGLDSVTMLYKLCAEGHSPHVLSFNYGQRHRKELTFAALHARKFNLPHDVVDLSGITHLISNSALTRPGPSHCICAKTYATYEGPERECPIHGDDEHRIDDIEVPDGHYAEENMKITVVPNRNMIMLSIAAGVAVNENAAFVAFGAHSGDHFIYPDCRPFFFRAANAAIVRGNAGFGPIREDNSSPAVESQDYIRVPFINMSKADIAYQALALGVLLRLTWSCYKGGDNHCGRCGTCVERLEAIHTALSDWNGYPNRNAEDHTTYEDTEFWKTAVKKEVK